VVAVEAHVDAILKSLVAVAWADGRLDGTESEVLQALIEAFELGEQDAARVRDYARRPRTLDDVPLTELSADDRRMLLQHAVLLTYIDGEQSQDEKALLHDLAGRLRIPDDEANQVLASSERRARRLAGVL
jgi:tellurite resistance protein